MNDFDSAADAFRDGIARICRLYGLSPLLGRLYAELYLHTGPLSLEELSARVGAAKSTASVAIRKLLSARVVKRVEVRGDRRDLYEAVVDPWTIFADWARLFFRPEIAMWRETGGALERSLGGAPADVNRDALRDRLATMRDFVETFETFVEQLSGTRAESRPSRSRRIEIDGGES